MTVRTEYGHNLLYRQRVFLCGLDLLFQNNPITDDKGNYLLMRANEYSHVDGCKFMLREHRWQ